MHETRLEDTNDGRPDPADAEPWPRRYWATWTVGGVLAVLLIQFAISMTRPEPYPAFLFPGFANVPFSTTTVQVRDVRIQLTTEDGNVHELSHDDVFFTVPPVHAYALTQRLFRPQGILSFMPSRAADSTQWRSFSDEASLGASHEVYVPLSDPDSLREQWLPRWHEHTSRQALHQQFRAYLRSHPRFDSLSPPDTILVQWQRRSVSRDGAVRSEAESTYMFPLVTE